MNDRRMIGLLATILLLWLALGLYIKFGDTAVIIGVLVLATIVILTGPFLGLFLIWKFIRWFNRRDDPRYAKQPPDHP